jgi:hypothetical protein
MFSAPCAVLAAVLATALCSLSAPAHAGPDIDVVYGDDIARRGELAGELASRWSQSARSGDLAGRSVWQAQGELSYGLSDQFNLGIKLPATRIDGSWRGNGGYVEAKYVAPHADQGFYWGAEIEAGSIRPYGEERSAVLEAFPILGYRAGRYHLTANPGLEYSAEGEDKGWEFSPKVKLAYQLGNRHAVGLEYHLDAGKFGNFTPRPRRSETAYLTLDSQVAGQKVSLALGHGTTRKSDRWAIRLGIEFDD